MASLETEYGRFLEHLRDQNPGEDVRRLANLIRMNLKYLAAVGAGRRARSSRLAPIVIRQIETTCPDIEAQDPIPVKGPDLLRLHQLKVGPFRGFMRSETFDLSRDITLVYGSNGTGKSSFCEAMEMAMLGSISEAIEKRIEDLVYCDNVRAKQHVMPILTTIAADGAISPLAANEYQYRFCFIEKNRLDAFARIAARSRGDQRQLLSTLFGIDQFSDFVHGFNPSLDESLQLVGAKATQLKLAREQLAASEQIVARHPHRMEIRQVREAELAQSIAPRQNYEAMITWLIGTVAEPGRFSKVQTQLDAPSPTVRGFTAAQLTTLLDTREQAMHLWSDTFNQLTARVSDVSYSQLYEAVLALRDGAESCPACGTNLAQVESNPFDRAREGLLQLAELAALQTQERSSRKVLAETVQALWVQMVNVVSALKDVCLAEFEAAQLPALPAAHSGEWLAQWTANDFLEWTKLLKLVVVIEQQDLASRRLVTQRMELVQERDQLSNHRLLVERHQATVAIQEQEYELAQSTIKEFAEVNQALIAEVENEKALTALHERVKAAYDEYLPLLQRYLSSLPTQLIQGLADLAKELYNAFNRDDHAADKLVELSLPVAESQKIEIVFAGTPPVRHDALVVLSEGHIRCLGLAILLAKNIEQHCRMVIFDDVVNAIDDDHRNGILRTLFEDGLLNEKQIVLTSHAEEFLLRIQQALGAERAGKIKCYKFLPHAGDHELRVDANPPEKNYVLLARQAFANEEKRDALRHARPAIESLTDQLWTWMSKNSVDRLELKFSGPKATFELNDKCAKLRKAFRRLLPMWPKLNSAVLALDKLLGVAGPSIEWGYLNSGTHDSQQNHEFDRTIVKTIIESVNELDAALVELRNGA